MCLALLASSHYIMPADLLTPSSSRAVCDLPTPSPLTSPSIFDVPNSSRADFCHSPIALCSPPAFLSRDPKKRKRFTQVYNPLVCGVLKNDHNRVAYILREYSDPASDVFFDPKQKIYKGYCLRHVAQTPEMDEMLKGAGVAWDIENGRPLERTERLKWTVNQQLPEDISFEVRRSLAEKIKGIRFLPSGLSKNKD